MRIKFLTKQQDSTGGVYGIAQRPNGKYGVYVLKENYSSRAKGGIRRSWECCAIDLSLSEAWELFNQKIKGQGNSVKRPSYEEAVQWIVDNDMPEEGDLGHISTRLVADLFGKDTTRVLQDVFKERSRSS